MCFKIFTCLPATITLCLTEEEDDADTGAPVDIEPVVAVGGGAYAGGAWAGGE